MPQRTVVTRYSINVLGAYSTPTTAQTKTIVYQTYFKIDRLVLGLSHRIIQAMKKILILEDDQQLQKLLQNAFKYLYDCTLAGTLSAAYAALDTTAFDLVVIDRRLPDGDGLEVIEYLHDTAYQTKIVALSSRGELQDRLAGLEGGADEYLAKPFSLAELKIKIEKLLKVDKKIEQSIIKSGNITFCSETGVVTFGNKEINLRRREAEILHCLLRYKNQVVTREMIMDDVWASEDSYPSATTLDVYIRRLRVLLEDYSKLITTIRGFGYKFTDSAVARR